MLRRLERGLSNLMLAASAAQEAPEGDPELRITWSYKEHGKLEIAVTWLRVIRSRQATAGLAGPPNAPPRAAVPRRPLLGIVRPRLMQSTAVARQQISDTRALAVAGFEHLGLEVRAEGVDHVLDVAVEHTLQVVARQADAMVCQAILREVVGADLFRALAAADL